MRFSWAQTAAGALFVVVLGGLALLPGRLLGPDHRMQVGSALPQRLAVGGEVQAVPPLSRHVGPVTQVVVVRAPAHSVGQPVPVRARFVTPRSSTQSRPVRAVPVVQPTAVIAHVAPEAPKVPAAAPPAPAPTPAPAPAPAAPAPTPTPTPPAAAPAATPAAPPTPAPTPPSAPAATAVVESVVRTVATAVTPLVAHNDVQATVEPPVVEDQQNGDDNGQGSGNGNGNGNGQDNGQGNGNGKPDENH